MAGFVDRARRELTVFWAAPTDGSAAAVFRIAFGLLAVWTSIGVGINLERYFSEDGLVPLLTVSPRYSFYVLAPDAAWMPTAHLVALAGGAALYLIGLSPRLAALVLAAAHISLQARMPHILNSGDRLFSILAVLSATMPLGHRYSVDALIRKWRARPTPEASVWGLRLVQIQVAYVYANATLSKLSFDRWRDGSALYDVLASPVFAEWPTWVDSTLLIAAGTYGTLLFEASFPTFVWFRKLRPFLLLGGVFFHLGIEITMVIPMFSPVMIVSYAAFLEDRDVDWVKERLRSFVARVRARSARRAHDRDR